MTPLRTRCELLPPLRNSSLPPRDNHHLPQHLLKRKQPDLHSVCVIFEKSQQLYISKKATNSGRLFCFPESRTEDQTTDCDRSDHARQVSQQPGCKRVTRFANRDRAEVNR